MERGVCWAAPVAECRASCSCQGIVPFSACVVGFVRHRARPPLRGVAFARKISEEERAAAGDWAALAHADPADDELKSEQINQVCNKGLRLMLAGDEQPFFEYRDELSAVGQTAASEGNMDGALFIYVLYKMTENVLPKEATQLKGVYLKAFEKMFNMLEDSGWVLGKEEQQESTPDEAGNPSAVTS